VRSFAGATVGLKSGRRRGGQVGVVPRRRAPATICSVVQIWSRCSREADARLSVFPVMRHGPAAVGWSVGLRGGPLPEAPESSRPESPQGPRSWEKRLQGQFPAEQERESIPTCRARSTGSVAKVSDEGQFGEDPDEHCEARNRGRQQPPTAPCKQRNCGSRLCTADDDAQNEARTQEGREPCTRQMFLRNPCSVKDKWPVLRRRRMTSR
jgi:hypothetical protein